MIRSLKANQYKTTQKRFVVNLVFFCYLVLIRENVSEHEWWSVLLCYLFRVPTGCLERWDTNLFSIPRVHKSCRLLNAIRYLRYLQNRVKKKRLDDPVLYRTLNEGRPVNVSKKT